MIASIENMKLYTTVILLLIGWCIHAQEIEWKGQVVDENDQPIAFANVIAIRDTQIIKADLTDDSGAFTLIIPSGRYTLKITYLGYDPYERITDLSSSVNEGKIKLKIATNELSEITVTDFRNVTEAGIDKKVIHVSEDLKKMNTNLSEILEMVSLVNMDMEGTPSIPGKQGVIVLVNGRPPQVRANDLATVLRLIPTDQILRIEIMTNPPAKYTKTNDAVINVITNRKPQRGRLFNGWGRVNDFGAVGAGGNYTWKKDQWGASIWGGRWAWKSRSEISVHRTNFLATENYKIEETLRTNHDGNGFYGGFAPEYQWDEKNIISFNAGMFAWNNFNDASSATTVKDNNEQLQRQFNRTSDGEFRGLGGYVGMEYFRYFDEKEKELTVDVELDFDRDRGDDLDEITGATQYYQNIINKDQSLSVEVELEFFDPIDSSSSLNYAVEYDQTFSYDEYSDFFSGTQKNKWEKEEGLSYHNTIAQSSQEASISYARKLKNFGINLDLGQTWIRYDFLFDQERRVNRDYFFLVPKASVNFQPLEGLEMGLSYKFSSEAPYRYVLNPNLRPSADGLTIWYGNPNLDPENSHNVELNSGFYLGKFNIGLTAFWRHSNNAISPFSRVNENGVREDSYENQGEYTRTGMDLSVSGSFKKWLKIDISGALFDSRIKQNEGLSQQTIGSNAKVQLSAFLPHQISVRMSARYSGPELNIQGQRFGQYIFRASLKKSFMDGRFNTTLSFDDIFRSAIRDTEWIDPAFTIFRTNQRFRPYVTLRANVRIGELKERPKSSKAGKQR